MVLLQRTLALRVILSLFPAWNGHRVELLNHCHAVVHCHTLRCHCTDRKSSPHASAISSTEQMCRPLRSASSWSYAFPWSMPQRLLHSVQMRLSICCQT